MDVLRGRRRGRVRPSIDDSCDDRFAARAEDGFTIVETMVAMGIIFTVLVGLLASLNTGIRGVLTGRQRTGGTAVAREVVEAARATPYDRLGHDLAGDATLSTDPDVAGPGPNWTYQPEGLAAEPLAGAAAPAYPEHEWSLVRDGSTFTVRVYVTSVAVAVGEDHKRLSVQVDWAGEQYDDAAIANEVRLSTLVSRSGVASGDEVDGVVDVDAGSVGITGMLAGTDLSRAEMYLPYSHSEAAGHLVSETRGYAGSARSELALLSGSASGCSPSGLTVVCEGVTAETATDNDGGTVLPVQEVEGPTPASGGTVSSGSALSLVTGSGGSVTSSSSAESCTACAPPVGDGDLLVYGDDLAQGPASMSAGFTAGSLSGDLVKVGNGGSARATVDSDPATTSQRMTATGRLVVPQIELVTLSAGPVGFTSGVQVSAVDASAQAQAGPAAAAPTVTGNAVSVTVYDTGALGVPTYRTVSITPGTASTHTASVSFLAGLATVTLDTTIASGAQSLSSQSSGGVVVSSSAGLSNWFIVTTRLRIVEAGVTVADLTIELDYGRLTAQTEYVA